ncbi:hypothetical protein [Achromobacter phage Motura]|uniref:Uncharacterized protein n=1 Tax=Achromobacter phage Motura TaxID=2591403 RepID=A0A514CSN9_9CAUD|nr:hypothetical protein H1O15_gp313 [Achromobacter phage Motura]QDH83493.1 hypothetical protein [Achromobacter phage Motura]
MKKQDTGLVVIDFRNPNFFEWGANWARMGEPESEVHRLMDEQWEYEQYSTEDRDEFWRGYHATKEQQA